MTTFQDGPAKGKVLQLRRAPYFLRVTEQAGEFDALDQLEDHPRPGEKLYVYRLTHRPGWMHVRASGGRGGMFVTGNYQLVAEQPSDAEMRTTPEWRAWVERNRPAEFPT